MAIIYTYPQKSTLSLSDSVLITDNESVDPAKRTKQATVQALSNAIAGGLNVVDSVNNIKGDVSITGGTNITVTPSGQNIEISTSASNVDGSGTTNKIPIWTDSNTLGDSLISQNGTSVGVRTASGTAVGSLEVYSGSAYGQLYVTCSDTSQAAMNLGGVSAKSKGRINYSANSDEMNFWVNSVEKMRITSVGNVGIGTTIPGAKLDINNDVQIDTYQAGIMDIHLAGYVKLLSDAKAAWEPGDEFGKIEFYSTDPSGIGARNAASIRAVNSYSGATFEGELAFYTSLYNSAEAEAVRIDGVGNVGIGTTSPLEKLDVVGNIKTSGYLSLSKGSNNLKISTPATITTSYELVMPAAVGTASQVLKLPSTIGTSPYQLAWGDSGGGITPTAEGGTGSAISSAAAYSVLLGNGGSGSSSVFVQSGENETAIQLPVGATNRRPTANAANVGLIRYNSQLAKFEGIVETSVGSGTYSWVSFDVTS